METLSAPIEETGSGPLGGGGAGHSQVMQTTSASPSPQGGGSPAAWETESSTAAQQYPKVKSLPQDQKVGSGTVQKEDATSHKRKAWTCPSARCLSMCFQHLHVLTLCAFVSLMLTLTAVSLLPGATFTILRGVSTATSVACQPQR